MEVTRSNFKEALPKVTASIDNAEFIAIDCEMTGLRVSNNTNAYDTPQEYYEKLHKASKQFVVVQYGLSCFRYEESLNSFKQDSYTFYITPAIPNNFIPDRTFLCQSSSMNFLSQHKFDFNKVFKQGIFYLNLEEQEKYQKTLLDIQKARTEQVDSVYSPGTKRMSMSAGDKKIVDSIFDKIMEFIASDEEEKVLPPCNRYIRKLIYSEASHRLGKKALLETRDVENSDDKLFVVTKWKNVEQRMEKNTIKIQKENDEFQSCIGFTHVIQHLVNSQKLIVGHNMMLDIFHTVDQFLTNLPPDYAQFKQVVHDLFPNIIDTKQICNSTPFKDLIESSVLVNVMESLKKPPFIIPVVEIEEDGEGYELANDKFHEAGYDAFLTGMCFLTMWNYLIKEHDSSPTDFKVLDPYINRLFLMRLFDFAHTNLAGSDPEINKDHVFHLKFPKHWKQSDIVNLFQTISSISIAWINSESAFVGLHKRDEAAYALRTLSKNKTYQIKTYAQYHQQLLSANLKEAVEAVETTKRKLSSDEETTTKKSKIPKRNSECNDSVDEMVVERDGKPVKLPPSNILSKNVPDVVVQPVKHVKPKKTKKNPFEESSDWS